MRAPRLFAFAIALLLATASGAQTTYRWVDPASGKTVYSDQAPPADARQVIRSEASAASAAETSPPYATRLAAQKFPVTLYTSASCGEPCAHARALLAARAVPFAEKRVDGNDEQAGLAALTGRAAVPTLFVGRQHLVGFEAGAWDGLLDLAGYPANARPGAKPPQAVP